LETTILYSPRGVPVAFPYREDTNDLPLAQAHLTFQNNRQDEYRLGQLRLDGIAVDIGAHTGAVTASLLADNPDLSVVAIEPLAANCAVIETLLRLNGWTERCRVLEAAIGSEQTADIKWGYSGSHYAHDTRYVGGLPEANAQTLTVPTITLSGVLSEPPALIVTDCEGCEWVLFRDPIVQATPIIVGEWHYGTADELRAALPGHTIELDSDDDLTSIGRFWAVLHD
jgi:FkbM family methyltransferase